MPTYEYACTSCGEHLEVVQSFKDDPLTTCPSCSGTLRKVFSPIGVVFKGSGFYKTDSRGAERRTGAGAAKEPAATEATAKDSGAKEPGAKDTHAGSDGAASSSNGSSSESSSSASPSSTPASTGSGSVAAAS